MSSSVRSVELIPVDEIGVMNPRTRNQRVFRDVVENIAVVGLKRPITITERGEPNGPKYELVCGQGRLEAYKELGQDRIPAVIIHADKADCMLMSLVENVARRHRRPIELLAAVEELRNRGYDFSEIAAKTGLSDDYIKGVMHLLELGEQRLIHGVATGQIPLSIAVEIAGSDDVGIRRILTDAYERKLLRGRKLLAARRVIERRRRSGRRLNGVTRQGQRFTVEALLQSYQEDVDRKRQFIRRADSSAEQLQFIVHAMRVFMAEPEFRSLLETQRLNRIPGRLAVLMERKRGPT